MADPQPSLDTTPRSSTRAKIAVLLVSSLLAYVVAEIGYRVHLYGKIDEHARTACFWIQDHTLVHSPVDDYFKRTVRTHPKGLFKVDTVMSTTVVHPTVGVQNYCVRTNNLGLLSDHDYELDRNPEKPEIRIVLLGESFTGATTCTYQWVDTLEELLNSCEELRKRVGGKVLRTYNLGWIGGAFGTFFNEWDRVGVHLKPDYLVINYTEVDFSRNHENGAPHWTTEDEMMAYAKRYLDKILDAFGNDKNVLFTNMPTYNDLLPAFSDLHLTHRLAREWPRLKIDVMRDRLPTKLGSEEVESWYSVPWDAHMSDRGGEVYVRALASVIAERVSGLKIDFSKSKSKHSDEVLPSRTTRNRKVTTPLTPLANDAAKLARLRASLREAMIDGKVRTFYPYLLHTLLGTGSNGKDVMYTRPMSSGFQKFQWGPNPEDVVFLFVSSPSQPMTLSNPENVFHFHMFVDPASAESHVEQR